MHAKLGPTRFHGFGVMEETDGRMAGRIDRHTLIFIITDYNATPWKELLNCSIHLNMARLRTGQFPVLEYCILVTCSIYLPG